MDDDADIYVMQPGLSIEKTADRDTCDVGDIVTFTVTVTQTTEDATETNVVITDPLPAGLALSGTPTLSGVEGDVSVDGDTVTANIPSLSYGESAVITVDTTADESAAGKTITNTAYAYGDHTDEINDDAAVTVSEPDASPDAVSDPDDPETAGGVKTGQAIGGIMAAIAAVIAIAGIVIVARRRRRI